MLLLEMSTLESLYCGHFTSSTQLIKPNYVRLLAQFFIVLLRRRLSSRRTSVTIPLMLAVYRRDKDRNGAGSKTFYY